MGVMMAKYDLIKDKDLSYEQMIVDHMMDALEESRDLSQCICHIDMDAFYASVEELDRPELKNKPMAVGDLSMLSTSNYEARKFGVRSAMPGFIALKLCPSLELISPHYSKYTEASNKVRAVFAKYDPDFTPMSLDEAYLNITEYLKESGLTPSELVEQIRQEIYDTTQLTASAGIACNNMLSKICSDINKPNGQFYLPISKSAIMDFMKDLKIRRIPGVGRVTERVLGGLGIHTCGDVYTHRALLYKLLTPVTFKFMIKSYLGIGSWEINTESARKSVSVERTFHAMSNPTALYAKLKDLCHMLEEDLIKKDMMGKTISIKLKLVSFEVRIRSKTLPSYIWKADDLYKITEGLLRNELPVNIRLMGLRIATLKPRISEDETVLKYFKRVGENDLGEGSKHEMISQPNIPDNQDQPIRQDMIEEEEEMSRVTCPICHIELVVNNTAFNHHIDVCLNKGKVKSLLNKRSVSPVTNTSKAKSSKRIMKTNKKKKGEKSLLDYYKKT